MATDASETVAVTTEILDDRTMITVDGERDVAVIVDSPAGERVYLPPEPSGTDDADDTSDAIDSPYEGLGGEGPYDGVPTDSPYEGLRNHSPYERLGAASPYEGLGDDDPYDGLGAASPYEGLENEATTSGDEHFGVVPTATGFRIVHPEPVDDVRFLR